MNAEIITIGDEILIGQITDTNSKWIAEELNKIGISVYQITSIQDDGKHILKALREAQSNANIVIVTGGLGPTKDDITKHTLSEYFEDHLILNYEIADHIKEMFDKMNYPFTELNRQQAMLPSKCTVLKNYWGTASGMWFKNEKGIVISLPGVPNEMKGIMQKHVFPKLTEKYNLPYIIHRTILTQGMGESMVAERIELWENSLPKEIKLAYLPSYGKVRLRLTAKGNNKEFLEEIIENFTYKLLKLIPDFYIGMDGEDSLELLIGKILIKNGQTLSIAESCTGGNISKLVSNIPGASNYFLGGIVAYNVNIKIDELHVSEEIIENHSVVSGKVAEAMALGIQKKYKSDFAIATTGNAGPTTDKTDKSVGVVFIAVATPKGSFSEEFFFGQPREKVIQRASNKALEILYENILKN